MKTTILAKVPPTVQHNDTVYTVRKFQTSMVVPQYLLTVQKVLESRACGGALTRALLTPQSIVCSLNGIRRFLEYQGVSKETLDMALSNESQSAATNGRWD